MWKSTLEAEIEGPEEVQWEASLWFCHSAGKVRTWLWVKAKGKVLEKKPWMDGKIEEPLPGTELCPTPHSYIEAPTASVSIFEDGDFKKTKVKWGHKGKS